MISSLITFSFDFHHTSRGSNDICQPGVTIALADFGNKQSPHRQLSPVFSIVHHCIGTLFDFHANDCKEMKAEFTTGTPRGGAPITWAPEIAFAPNKKVELDYPKADVWSLGLVVANMMAICGG